MKFYFLPNGLMAPEIHGLLSLIQEDLDRKKQLSIITCGGPKNASCSLNIYGVKEICIACKSRRNNALKKLEGNFKIYEMNKIYKFPKKFNKKKIKDLKYKKIDFGLGVYSSYTNTSRDTYIDGNISFNTIKNLINTSYSFYKIFKNILKEKKIDELIIYNSRMSEKRPVFRYASLNNIKVSNYERLSNSFYNFKNFFSQDRKYILKQILSYEKKKCHKYNSFNKEKVYFRNKFYSKRDPIFQAVYTKGQKIGTLPSSWLPRQKNIVFFTVSDDEYMSFGKDYNPVFAKDQKQIIENTCRILNKKKDFRFWIRVHPRWKNSFRFNRKFYKRLEKKYSNIKVIYPEEKISSYTLLIEAYSVICFWSIMLLEAAYWRETKPISLTNNSYTEYGISIVPTSFKNYIYLITKNFNKNKKIKMKALVYAKFLLTAGIKFKYFNGSFESGYKFKNNNLNFSLLEKIFFHCGRTKEFIYNKFFNS